MRGRSASITGVIILRINAVQVRDRPILLQMEAVKSTKEFFEGCNPGGFGAAVEFACILASERFKKKLGCHLLFFASWIGFYSCFLRFGGSSQLSSSDFEWLGDAAALQLELWEYFIAEHP